MNICRSCIALMLALCCCGSLSGCDFIEYSIDRLESMASDFEQAAEQLDKAAEEFDEVFSDMSDALTEMLGQFDEAAAEFGVALEDAFMAEDGVLANVMNQLSAAIEIEVYDASGNLLVHHQNADQVAAVLNGLNYEAWEYVQKVPDALDPQHVLVFYADTTASGVRTPLVSMVLYGYMTSYVTVQFDLFGSVHHEVVFKVTPRDIIELRTLAVPTV